VLFTFTNESQHIRDNWLFGAYKCWFPYLKADCKETFLYASQISKMIKKCIVQNNDVGTIHQIAIIARPFCE